MDSRYKQRHGKEVEEEQGTQIQNINEIPERKFNELQENPLSEVHLFDASNASLGVGPSFFKSLIVCTGDNQTIIPGVYPGKIPCEIKGINLGTTSLPVNGNPNISAEIIPEGMTNEVKTGGSFKITYYESDKFSLSGDLIPV